MRQSKRIQGRQGLQLNEQSLQILVETIPALMWRAKPDGQIDYVNKRLLEYFGSPLEEIIGWGWTEKAHPDDVAFKARTWLSNLETTTSHDVSCRFQGADGAYRWFNVRGEPLRDSDGSVQGWYGVFIDIDSQKKAEEKSRESELKLRQITETIPGLVWSTDPTARRPISISAFWTTAACDWRIFSIVAGKHSCTRPTFQKPRGFLSRNPNRNFVRGCHRLRRSDGEYRWHHARGEPLRDRQGRIIQWYGLSVDIDERKKTEDQLRRSEAYLAEAERLSHTGSSAYNETKILYLSDEAHRMFGFDPLQGIPSREAVWQRIHPDDLDRTNETIERAVREKRSFGNEFRIMLPDGTIRHVEAINDPVFSANGELLEIIATGIDVTERKRAEQALRESEAKFRSAIDGIAGLVSIHCPER